MLHAEADAAAAAKEIPIVERWGRDLRRLFQF
jgi:hypothetical protein